MFMRSPLYRHQACQLSGASDRGRSLKRMARKIQICALILGALIFGATRIDIYTAHDVPVALFPLLGIVYWTPSLSETLLVVSSLGYHAGILFLLLLWWRGGNSKLWTALAIAGFLVEAVFVFYMSIGSGYQNREAFIGTLFALSLLIPSLLVIANRSEQDSGEQPATRSDST